jgi:hypothetical protein
MRPSPNSRPAMNGRWSTTPIASLNGATHRARYERQRGQVSTFHERQRGQVSTFHIRHIWFCSLLVVQRPLAAVARCSHVLRTILKLSARGPSRDAPDIQAGLPAHRVPSCQGSSRMRIYAWTLARRLKCAPRPCRAGCAIGGLLPRALPWADVPARRWRAKCPNRRPNQG